MFNINREKYVHSNYLDTYLVHIIIIMHISLKLLDNITYGLQIPWAPCVT